MENLLKMLRAEKGITSKNNADGRKNTIGARNSPQGSLVEESVRITWLNSGHTVNHK